MSQPPQSTDSPKDTNQTKRPQTFNSNLDSIPEPISKLLETYSGIPPESQISHILSIRNKAYESYPYPCLGRFRFLSLDLSSFPAYKSHILPILTNTNSADPDSKPIFLDLGTCLGQDLRKLIHDGVSPSQVYGSDIVPSFIDNGYELFRDEHKFPRSHFLVPGDVFASPDDQADQLRLLDDKVDVLNVTAVFHLFALEPQKQIARRCLRLMRKNTGGKVLILGAQVGNVNAREMPKLSGNGTAFRHNADSWEKLWNEVIRDETGEWKDVVKDFNVKSILSVYGRPGSFSGNVSSGNEAEGKGHASQDKDIERSEEGLRVHYWEIWLEFH